MRTRDEINDEVLGGIDSSNSFTEIQARISGATLEVLLDIRDLLANPPVELPE